MRELRKWLRSDICPGSAALQFIDVEYNLSLRICKLLVSNIFFARDVFLCHLFCLNMRNRFIYQTRAALSKPSSVSDKRKLVRAVAISLISLFENARRIIKSNSENDLVTGFVCR